MMIKPPYLNKVLTKTGFVLCDKCNGDGQPDDKKIHAGDTYAEDPCDHCAKTDFDKTLSTTPGNGGGLFFEKSSECRLQFSTDCRYYHHASE